MRVRIGALLRCLLRGYSGARAETGRFVLSSIKKNNTSSTRRRSCFLTGTGCSVGPGAVGGELGLPDPGFALTLCPVWGQGVCSFCALVCRTAAITEVAASLICVSVAL